MTSAELAQTMKHRLSATGWTVREWSRRCNVSHTTLCYWLHGEHLDDAMRVLAALEVLDIRLRVFATTNNESESR